MELRPDSSQQQNQNDQQIPLLSPRAFRDFSAVEWKAYVESLYVAPPAPAKKADFSCKLKEDGGFVLTVRRDPKWLSADEVNECAREVGIPLQDFWLAVRKRKIEIRVPDLRRKRG